MLMEAVNVNVGQGSKQSTTSVDADVKGDDKKNDINKKKHVK